MSPGPGPGGHDSSGSSRRAGLWRLYRACPLRFGRCRGIGREELRGRSSSKRMGRSVHDQPHALWRCCLLSRGSSPWLVMKHRPKYCNAGDEHPQHAIPEHASIANSNWTRGPSEYCNSHRVVLEVGLRLEPNLENTRSCGVFEYFSKHAPTQCIVTEHPSWNGGLPRWGYGFAPQSYEEVLRNA